MSEICELILLLNKQHQEQMAVLRDEHRKQNKQHNEQMTILPRATREKMFQHPMASFQAFDSTSELQQPVKKHA